MINTETEKYSGSCLFEVSIPITAFSVDNGVLLLLLLQVWPNVRLQHSNFKKMQQLEKTTSTPSVCLPFIRRQCR